MKKLCYSKSVARIFDWGAQTTNHTGENQKKKSSLPDLGFLIGLGLNLIGDQFMIGGPNHN